MIRPATHQDIGAILRLMESVPGFRQEDWSNETLAKALDAAGGLAFVWEEDGEVLGFACGHDWGFRAYVSVLVVAERARDRGIGRTLVEHLQRELSERGGTS